MYIAIVSHGSAAQSHIIRRHFACTQQELPNEIARVCKIDRKRLLALSVLPESQRSIPDADLQRVYGAVEVIR